MRFLRAGHDGLLIELDTQGDVSRLYAELQRRRPADVEEIVPGARTILLIGGAHERLRDEIASWTLPAPARSGASVVQIPVHYDGPDLQEVAGLSGRSVEDVIALHSGAEYEVAFCGFAPGFAYLSGLPPALQVPRRATPRTQVPAGAVAIAGEYSGVYPRASPGGWQLIGRTQVQLWDATRNPPALLAPGARVRFTTAGGQAPPTDAARARSGRAGDPSRSDGRGEGGVAPACITVLKAGSLSTVQDLGRAGYAHLGVPRSGALDVPALVRANRLVGNPDAAAGLEMTLMGAQLHFRRAAMIVFTGAEMPATLDGSELPRDAAVPIRAGQIVAIGAARRGVRAYLAVAGGIEAPLTLGSRSTDLLSGLGPPALRDGDVLGIGALRGVDGAPPPVRVIEDEPVLRILAGPRDDWFAAGTLPGLCAQRWTVSPDSNRIGLRLRGVPLARAIARELPSEGLVAGAIQVTPDGQPVVMLADHPTTGGYPVIAAVTAEDLPVLAQCRPGSFVRFAMAESA